MFRTGHRIVGQMWKRDGSDTIASCRGSRRKQGSILGHVSPRRVVGGRNVAVYEGCGTRRSGSRG